MAPLRVLCALAVLGAVRGAAAVLTCPTSNQQNTSCLCTSGCSVAGDTAFAWSAAAYPPPVTPLGKDTICATVVVPCSPGAAANLTAWLGITGNVQFDNIAR